MFYVGVKDRPKVPRKPRQKAPKGSKSETSLHWHVAGLLDKHLAPPAWWTTFPAGGGGEMRGKILKGLGLKSGVPDILIIVPMTVPASAINGPISEFAVTPRLYWIELKKTGVGKPSDNQLKTQAILTGMGCRVANCDNLADVKAALVEWKIPYQTKSARQTSMQNAIENAFANV